jgi:hypothetical protein
MIASEVRLAYTRLVTALGLEGMTCGQITLNVNNGDLSSVDRRDHFRIPKILDRTIKPSNN